VSSFKINSDRLLEVDLQNERVLAIAGAMVAYTGTMKFEKVILGGEGIFGALPRQRQFRPLISGRQWCPRLGDACHHR
jgi:uncharacterized protein (AIM24 family)